MAVALTHLAFWDERQRAALDHYLATSALLGEDSDEAVNVALERVAHEVDPVAAGRLALAAAEAVDAAIAPMPSQAITAILATAQAYQVRRHQHRDEHIAQIEAGLRS